MTDLPSPARNGPYGKMVACEAPVRGGGDAPSYA